MHRTLIVLLFLPLSTFGQHFTGRVIDAGSKAGVPYASVTLKAKNILINADENGTFSIIHDIDLRKDTLVVTSVGYRPVQLPITRASAVIELQKKENILRTITVSSKRKWETSTLKYYSGCGDYTLTSNGLSRQVAQLFEAPAAGTKLSAVSLCTGQFFDSHKSHFRIRIYARDTVTKGPGEELFNEPIDVFAEARKENIDLEKYHIVIPEKEFFVAVEWLFIPENKKVDFIKMDNKTIRSETYRPNIGMKKTDVPSQGKVWHLLHDRWSRWSGELSSISAVIKY